MGPSCHKESARYNSREQHGSPAGRMKGRAATWSPGGGLWSHQPGRVLAGVCTCKATWEHFEAPTGEALPSWQLCSSTPGVHTTVSIVALFLIALDWQQLECLSAGAYGDECDQQ